MGKRRYELKSKILNLKESEEENKNKSVKITNLMLILTLSTVIALFLVYVIFLNNKNKKTLTLKNILLEENIKKNHEHILHNDLLLKELHHRVKNNLQLMYSLLNLQKRRNNNIEIKSNLSTVQNRIQTMALVHEYLYNSGNFESVEAFKYVETLANHLKCIYKQENRDILQIINIDPSIQLPIEQIISLGLIINEIISNSYKYAFNNNNGSKLEITLAKINNLIVLEISDDGPGFSKDQIKEDSLGLKLIEIMSTQIKAKLQSSCENGVSYNIEFTI
jgi:two-component sensor histidine kinase